MRRALGVDKQDVIDGLVERDFTRAQAACIADQIFATYQGARRQRLVEDLEGHIPQRDQAVLTNIVDACLTD
jgi:hypothetical protein